MVKNFHTMDRTLMKIAMWIVNNLQNTSEEIERVRDAIRAVCYDDFNFDIQFAIDDDGTIQTAYVDINDKINYQTWEHFKTIIPNYICFEDWCTIFVREYMKLKEDV